MRKRLLLGNVFSTLVVSAIAYALVRAGVGHDATIVVAAVGIIAFTSVHSIRVLNELLGRVSEVEEAALRVAHGETTARVGAVPPPLDGLAYRLDQVFEQLEQASSAGVESGESVSARDAG